MDITVQAMAGVMSITGFPENPPVKSGPALCDFFAGIHLYAGIATALYEREKTGTGRLVEVSMQEAVYASLSSNLALYHGSGGRSPRRTGNRHGGLAESPYNVYPAADGHVAIICNNNRHFLALLKAMKREDLAGDPRFADLKTRVAHMDQVDALVGAWTSTRTRAEIVELLLAVRVPHAPVRDLDDVVNDAHMHARRSLERIDHPEYGPIVAQNSPIRYDALPPLPLVPSGRLGQHSREVMCERFGLSPNQYDQMRAAGIFGASIPEASAKS
jgi:CoA:oxalate CoA-transferase